MIDRIRKRLEDLAGKIPVGDDADGENDNEKVIAWIVELLNDWPKELVVPRRSWDELAATDYESTRSACRDIGQRIADGHLPKRFKVILRELSQTAPLASAGLSRHVDAIRFQTATPTVNGFDFESAPLVMLRFKAGTLISIESVVLAGVDLADLSSSVHAEAVDVAQEFIGQTAKVRVSRQSEFACHVDQLGRFVAFVFAGEQCLNEHLLAGGFGRFDPATSEPFKKFLKRAEAKARRKSKGVWRHESHESNGHKKREQRT